MTSEMHQDDIKHPRVGGYNVYYGLLHSHSVVSDGAGDPPDHRRGSPDNAYRFARDVAELDFFSLADHSNAYHRNFNTRWPKSAFDLIYKAAQHHYEPERFVSLAGFEITTSNMGHISVIYNPSVKYSMADNYYYVHTNIDIAELNDFYKWLDTQPAVGFFNHPGEYLWDSWYPGVGWGPEFNFFNKVDGIWSHRVVGMELFNGNNGFEHYYYKYKWKRMASKLVSDGVNTLEADNAYDEALKKGWRIGAAGSDDNHSMRWGTMNDCRLAVLANNLTRADIFSALENRRFYSTMDKNLAVSFSIDGNEMGSTIAAGECMIRIEAYNTTDTKIDKLRLLKNGTEIENWQFGETHPIVCCQVVTDVGDYFYAIVTQENGREAITSPIWVE